MTIGLISDTHGYFDESLSEHFRSCNEIWHAGDIGNTDVIRRLKQMAPVQAVYGNIDDRKLQSTLPEYLRLEKEGVRILITHICGSPSRYNSLVARMLDEEKPHVLICGHSHICQVKKDERHNVLFINPGAAGNQGFHTVRTVMRLELNAGRISKLEVIELGKRGAIAPG